MIDPSAFIAFLRNCQVTFFVGVPDSLLLPFSACLAGAVPGERHVIAANEGSAIGLAAGYHLATGAIGCVYMQNSGLGNAINPLTSLMDAEVYAIPALLLIGWRGEMRDGKQIEDEPQHAKQGRITLGLLECLDIPYVVLQAETTGVEQVVGELVDRAGAESRPVALVVRRDTFSGSKADLPMSPYSLSRADGVKAVLEGLPQDAVIVSTTGKVSRELYEMRVIDGADPTRDFLTVGSMGHALQIASGIALARPDKTIVCIDGDGALIMHMGGMATSAAIPNLLHVVMNNGAHESVGGAPTRGFAIDLPAVARACGYTTVQQATSGAEVGYAVRNALAARGSAFVEIRTNLQSRIDLARPKTAPRLAKQEFMRCFEPVAD
ncbi:phosphonopyruvate decarboxylase [Tardiphaga sp. vice154]|uniref:phosphonopyruvate decarboxylase n=1 Tax=Tardiphaga sp. vice154 TaxID=2592814 RepID=UPI00116567F5|nr:phosphonopyruvate decarboxylase [Tardiphaga sp. vice154]QDM20167.1 phosphonopyruvate decarboxylase [Tardiphaga sp. vice154]